MKVCPICGHRDNPLWRSSRFEYNSDYMEFEEARNIDELKDIVKQLINKGTMEPVFIGNVVYYRRGTGGIYLYRTNVEDYRVRRERVRHIVIKE